MVWKLWRVCLSALALLVAGGALAFGMAWLAAVRTQPFPAKEPPWAQWNGWVWCAYSSGSGPLRVTAVNAGVAGWYRPPLAGEPCKAPPPWSIVAQQHPPKPAPTNLCEAACGWPWPCMYTRGRQELVPGSKYRSTWTAEAGGPLARAAVPAPSIDFSASVLPQLQAGPIGMLWGGLALDGLVWAALLGGTLVPALLAWGATRRAVRRRQGRCPRCGYPRQGLPVDARCPECGA